MALLTGVMGVRGGLDKGSGRRSVLLFFPKMGESRACVYARSSDSMLEANTELKEGQLKERTAKRPGSLTTGGDGHPFVC